MRMLVTGGAGFIGSHVVDGALAAGYEVCVLDDLSAGRREQVAKDAELIVGDVRDANLLKKIFSDFRPDVVSHHAAQVSVPRSITDPHHDLSVNALGTLSVLEAARLQGTRVVYASSGGAIYGEVREAKGASIESNPNPSTPYGCSKFAGELYVRTYAHHYELPSVILRYSNVYGPRQSDEGEGGVVAVFTKRFLSNKSVTIFAQNKSGDAGCVRDYVYVEDVVKANLAACEQTLRLPVLNICAGTETNTLQLATALKEFTGSDSKIEYADRRTGDVKRSLLIPSAMPFPMTALREGLRHTVDWARS